MHVIESPFSALSPAALVALIELWGGGGGWWSLGSGGSVLVFQVPHAFLRSTIPLGVGKTVAHLPTPPPHVLWLSRIPGLDKCTDAVGCKATAADDVTPWIGGVFVRI